MSTFSGSALPNRPPKRRGWEKKQRSGDVCGPPQSRQAPPAPQDYVLAAPGVPGETPHRPPSPTLPGSESVPNFRGGGAEATCQCAYRRPPPKNRRPGLPFWLVPRRRAVALPAGPPGCGLLGALGSPHNHPGCRRKNVTHPKQDCEREERRKEKSTEAKTTGQPLHLFLPGRNALRRPSTVT